MPEASTPAVSVVISTYNRSADLAELVDALDAQTFPADRFEIVVIDDGSQDETPELLARLGNHPRLHIRSATNPTNAGPAVGRNHGVRLATGPLVAFTDDDCRPSPVWLAEIVAAMDGRDDRVVVGRVEPEPGHDIGPFTRTLVVRDANYFQTANTAVPRALFDEIGGFDESYRRPGGEDTDLGLRLLEHGAEAVFASDALVHHAVSTNDLRGALRKARRWIDIGRVVRRHPAVRRELMHRRVFWKRSHPPTLLALLGLAAALLWPFALVAVLPWVYARVVTNPPLHRSRREHLLSLPGVFLVDATEVATMVRASLRGRTLIL